MLRFCHRRAIRPRQVAEGHSEEYNWGTAEDAEDAEKTIVILRSEATKDLA
jgi:hypothetical protein